MFIVGVRHHLSSAAVSMISKEMAGMGVQTRAFTVEGVGAKFICCEAKHFLPKGMEEIKRVTDYMEIIFNQTFEVWLAEIEPGCSMDDVKGKIMPLTKYHLKTGDKSGFESESVVHP